MKKISWKMWVGIVLIILVISSLILYWFYDTQRIRNKVLSNLAHQLEFCEIIRDNINVLGDEGEFWLICNGRPFYSEYKNGNVSYELNGWEFLKRDPTTWSELENCDFYDSRNSKLIFYCPKDFNSSVLTVKIYRFDEKLLKMKKVEEGNFLELLSDDIRNIYGFLTECEIFNFTSTKYEDYPAVLWLTFKCNDGNYIVATDLATVPLQPPILLDSLSYGQRAKKSFEKSFDCNISKIDTLNSITTISSLCENKEFVATYTLRDIPTFSYTIKCSKDEIEIFLKNFGKYFIFPPIEGIKMVESIGEVYKDIFCYRINNEDVICINWNKLTNSINALWKKTEGIYR